MEVPKHIELVLAYDRLFRSQIIYEAIDLEGFVDKMIAWYFCPEKAKHGLLFASLFREGELGLSKKLRILKRLLVASHPDLLKVGGFWIKKLDKLRDLRNKFAHGKLVLPDDPPPAEKAEGVSLRWPKPNGEEAEEFISKTFIDRWVSECRHLGVAGLCLELIVEKRETGNVDPKQEDALITLIGAIQKLVGKESVA